MNQKLDQNSTEFLKCANSFPYFLFNFVKTVYVDDYTGKSDIKLFPQYPYLISLSRELQHPENLHIEKSRQMLLSWIVMAVFLWDLLFSLHISNFVTSRKEDFVDDGGSGSTWLSLMGKIRFIWNNLPDFLKMPLEFKYLSIRNTVMGGAITGESSNPQAGRSGTFSRAVMDETAFIPRSESVFSATTQACKSGLILNSTPYGKGNVFSRIRFTNDTGFKKISLHWSQHPDRNQAWYEREKAKMTSSEVARELDISYEESVSGRVYNDFDFNSQIKPLTIDKNLPTYSTWDFGIGDCTSILWIQEKPVPGKGFEILIVDEYENNNQDPDHYCRIVNEWDKQHGLNYRGHTGDPSGVARGLNLKSWISWLRNKGIVIQYRNGVKYEDRILTVRRILKDIIVSDKCVLFQERISNYKFPVDEEGRVKDNKPVHDWASHMMTALEFYAIVRHPIRLGNFELI
jgi:hypothetical protein